jgi:hypothetical protein
VGGAIGKAPVFVDTHRQSNHPDLVGRVRWRVGEMMSVIETGAFREGVNCWHWRW